MFLFTNEESALQHQEGFTKKTSRNKADVFFHERQKPGFITRVDSTGARLHHTKRPTLKSEQQLPQMGTFERFVLWPSLPLNAKRDVSFGRLTLSSSW